MFSFNIGYPSRDDERRIANATTQASNEEIRPILSGRDLIWIQQLVREIPASDNMVDYAEDLVRGTRPKEPGARPSSRIGWPGVPRCNHPR
jgi:MoxR-like ATPase